ncbi:acylneuraminate cytidylyltransferase family protein [Rhodocyclus tenuis]|uniref:N-acylneuraminate cytidylyltransferase n=1 Tax=Rhodocyclus tenuis TaxID=1066 RepID=A0A840FX04_RHOTE|nr:acylneuraminate cytidylyltransferase family protein [Rhodocyclus tenuis]MBB4246314.1 CMP-N-acetylneuraminic acid synthetase [Rhodocyclus tenuis]
MKVLALIPARSGSKSIRHKNVRSVFGKPLIQYSIDQALSAKSVSRVVVSTDSAEYAQLAEGLGAEAPFLRPEAISGDLSTDLDVFKHALEWFKNNEGWAPDIIIHLRPTHPVRRPEDIDAAVFLLEEHPEWDSVRSVAPAPHPPFKMWNIQDGMLQPFAECGVEEAWNHPRQALPQVWLQNAAIDVTRPRTIIDLRSMTGQKIGAFPMRDFYDVDTTEELDRAVAALLLREEMPTGRTFVFDIDGVIATLAPANDYERAFPLDDNIALINRLYDLGNKIVLFTARGSATGRDWVDLTRGQMSSWGVKYHDLRFGKPAADFYVDDRMMSVSDLSSWISTTPL